MRASMPTVPVCAAWPTPPRPYDPDRAIGCDLLDWHAGRCGICGLDVGDDALVLDHDHRTGLVRGYICRPCNAKEGAWWIAGPGIAHWRAGLNSAALVGMVQEYYRHVPWEEPDPAVMRAAMMAASVGLSPLQVPDDSLRRAMLAAS